MALEQAQPDADATERCAKCDELIADHLRYGGGDEGAVTLCPKFLTAWINRPPGMTHGGVKTPTSKCIRCLNETSTEAYLANDHICDECADKEELFPLGSTS